MRTLQVIETAYRATLEEQDDTVAWLVPLVEPRKLSTWNDDHGFDALVATDAALREILRDRMYARA